MNMYQRHHSTWTEAECNSFVDEFVTRENAKSADMLAEWDHAYAVSLDAFKRDCWPVKEIGGRRV